MISEDEVEEFRLKQIALLNTFDIDYIHHGSCLFDRVLIIIHLLMFASAAIFFPFCFYVLMFKC